MKHGFFERSLIIGSLVLTNCYEEGEKPHFIQDYEFENQPPTTPECTEYKPPLIQRICTTDEEPKTPSLLTKEATDQFCQNNNGVQLVCIKNNVKELIGKCIKDENEAENIRKTIENSEDVEIITENCGSTTYNTNIKAIFEQSSYPELNTCFVDSDRNLEYIDCSTTIR